MKEVPLEQCQGGYAVGVINSYGGSHGVVLGKHLEQSYYFLNTDEMKAYLLTESDWSNMKMYVRGD